LITNSYVQKCLLLRRTVFTYVYSYFPFSALFLKSLFGKSFINQLDWKADSIDNKPRNSFFGTQKLVNPTCIGGICTNKCVLDYNQSFGLALTDKGAGTKVMWVAKGWQ